jgi:uncharacterized alpha-E superfamily protein
MIESAKPMLSRVAESMFWMSRYMERAENTARYLDVHFQLMLDLNKLTTVESLTAYWEPIVLVTSGLDHYQESVKDYTAESITNYLVFDRTNPNSIFSCVALARENARTIIESISSEMWEQVNNLYHFLQEAKIATVMTNGYKFYQEVKNGVHLFHGITDSTLSRTEGWYFLQAGRFLERADNTARLLEIKFELLKPTEDQEKHDSAEVIQWTAVLKSTSAREAFRKANLSKNDPVTVLQYLILDRMFPRSVYYSVSETEEALWKISGSSRHNYRNNADRLIGQLVSELSYLTIDEIFDRGLSYYLSEFQMKLAKVGEQIHLIYFAYHAPNIEHHFPEIALPFTGLTGARAAWSLADQQHQQQQQQ